MSRAVRTRTPKKSSVAERRAPAQPRKVKPAPALPRKLPNAGNATSAMRGKTGALPEVAAILDDLARRGSPRYRDNLQERFGVVGPTAKTAFGISMAVIQKIASDFKRGARSADGRAALHQLALDLWATGSYDARMLAALIDDPALVTAAQMDAWCGDFDNWATCDTACFRLFDRTSSKLAFGKVRQWARHPGEYQRRGAFALLASLALHDRQTADDAFIACVPLLEKAATDERNFVKKAVSWAMRGMGGRSGDLHAAMLVLARRLAESKDATARWIGKDVIRDITRPLVVRRAARGRRKSG